MCFPKIRIGVTGGIGSGKSFVCRMLERRGVPVFSCDECARREMLGNGALRRRLAGLLPGVFGADGGLDKRLLRGFMTESPENAALLNAAVHPLVRERWRSWARAQRAEAVAMECALLFEARFDSEVDFKVFVSAGEEERVARVMRRDGADAAAVRRWMGMQMPEEEKERLSDFTVRNGGADPLGSQIDALLSRARRR